jgi:hypothetical protein
MIDASGESSNSSNGLINWFGSNGGAENRADLRGFFMVLALSGAA